MDEIKVDPDAAYEEDDLRAGYQEDFAVQQLKRIHNLEPKDILVLTNIRQKLILFFGTIVILKNFL